MHETVDKGMIANEALSAMMKLDSICCWFPRSVVLFMAACAIACGSWLAVTIQVQRKQMVAAEGIKKAGGWVRFEPTWLGKVLRDDSLVNVTVVGLSGKATTDAVLVNLPRLSQLQELWLDNTNVTDAGLAHLERLSRLQWLFLDNTQITDAGLVHLRGLTMLRGLVLRGAQITDVGLSELQSLTALRGLDLRSTQITDAGLACLHELHQLEGVDLRGTKVTDDGIRQLQEALPDCEIRGQEEPELSSWNGEKEGKGRE
jgi:hypothetical protein